MKKLLTALLILISATSYRQVNLKTQGGSGGSGGISQSTLDDSTAAIRADFPSALDTIPIHDQLTQLYSGVALKLNITDTSILHAQLSQLYSGVAANTSDTSVLNYLIVN